MRREITRLDAMAIALLVFASWAVYRVAGVHFDATPFPGYMQFIDDALLRERFFESIWYSHAQPPLLNVVVGAGYNILGGNAPAFFAVLFHILGLVLVLCAFALAVRLSGSRFAAYACAALIAFSPGFVLYQNWLMYTFLEAVLVTASAVALYRTLDRGSATAAVTLFALLATLVLTRSFFHFGWMVLVVVYVVWAAPNRRQILGAAAVPTLLAGLWYAKNYFYFGTFAASTLFGLGLSNIGILTVPRPDLQRLVEQGSVSPLVLVSRYEDAAVLFSATEDSTTGIPVLDQARKSSGEYNFNYRPLIDISGQYARDSLSVIRQYPASYLIGLIISNRLFFSPSSMNEYFAAGNREAVEPFESLFNPLLYAVGAEPKYIPQPHFGFDQPPSLEVNTSVWLIVLWASVLIFGWVSLRPVLFRAAVTDRTARITLGYVIFVMLYVYLLSTLVELGENYRYRFPVEPMMLVVLTVMVVAGLRRMAGRSSVPG